MTEVIRNIGNFFTGNANKQAGPGSTAPPKGPVLIPDYDNAQTMQLDIEKFQADVAAALNTGIANIEILQEKSGLKARLKDSKEVVQINFQDKVDLSRMAKYALLSSTLNLIDFGDDKNGRKIKITDYEDGLSRESQIELFKDDIARETKTDKKFLEIHIIDNNLVARKKDSKDTFLVEFNDQNDADRFMKYAKETKSKRLEDFGVRKTEATISLGGDTRFPNPKENTTFSQSINYSTFLGDSGIHKLKVDLVTDANLVRTPDMSNVKDITVTYENSEMPLTGTYGNLKLSYKNGKFGVDGKYEFLDLQVDKWGKSIQKKLKEGDGETIAIASGVVAAVGIGIWAGAKYLPEPQEFDIPLRTRVYSNGLTEVRVAIEPTVTVGGGKISFDLNEGGLEVKHNIASGTNIREKATYDVEKKELSTEVVVNHDRANVRVANLYSFENPDLTKTWISIGKSHTVADGLNIGYSYSQELDRRFNPSNQNINFGMEYIPNETWRFNMATGVSIPKPGERATIGLGARTTYKF